MKDVNCQTCHKPIFIEIGKACKTCGMILMDEGKDFCSKNCRNVYERLRGMN